MPGTKKYSNIKSMEWINYTISNLYNKHEKLIKDTNDMASTISSSIWAAFFTIPLTLVGYVLQANNVTKWSLIFYILTIPFYIITWIFSDKFLIPFIKKKLEKRKTADLKHLESERVVEEFNNIIINKVLLISSMIDKYNDDQNNSDNLKRMYIVEIIEDWAYVIGFIRRRIIVNNPEQLIREYSNKSIELINQKINTYTILCILDMLSEINLFLGEKIKMNCTYDNFNKNLLDDFLLIEADLKRICSQIKRIIYPLDYKNINIEKQEEVINWCKILGCSTKQLKDAVKAEGTLGEDIRKFIENELKK